MCLFVRPQSQSASCYYANTTIAEDNVNHRTQDRNDQFSCYVALQYFTAPMAEQLVTAASTACGAGVVHIIKQALQAPGFLVFGKLLDLNSVIEVREGPASHVPGHGATCRWVCGLRYVGVTNGLSSYGLPHNCFQMRRSCPKFFEDGCRHLSIFSISCRRSLIFVNTRSGTISYGFLRTVLCATITVWCRSTIPKLCKSSVVRGHGGFLPWEMSSQRNPH